MDSLWHDHTPVSPGHRLRHVAEIELLKITIAVYHCYWGFGYSDKGSYYVDLVLYVKIGRLQIYVTTAHYG